MQNEGGNYSYFRTAEDKEYNFPPADGAPTCFRCRLGDSSYSSPKHGAVVAIPLTSIRGPKGIDALVDQMIALWHNRMQYMALTDV